MNTYIIIGLLIFALGSALGTGLIVYGQHVKNQADSTEVSKTVQEKIDNVLKHIDEVREGVKDQKSAGEINQIEQEFKIWAAEFLKNREQRKTAIARTHLDSVDVQLKVSNRWIPIFEYVLKTIDSYVQAYNTESGEAIKVNFPPIPQNLYSEEAEKYIGKVVFPNKSIWSIEFNSQKPAKEESPPKMIIIFNKEGDQVVLRNLSFCGIYREDEKSFRVILAGPDVPTVKDIEGSYLLESYRDSLKTIMRSIFEAQLLQD